MKALRWVTITLAAAMTAVLLPVSRTPMPAPASAAEAQPADQINTPPNVLVIMTDDQTVADMRALPKTRALLGEQGTTFTNSFVSYPLCCPSRSTFLTGQLAHNHRVWQNSGPRGGYQRLDHSNTLPLWLQAAGYYTVHIGKYLNNYGVDSPEAPPGWSHWFGLIDPSTYKMYGYTVSVNGVPMSRGNGTKAYQTDMLAGEAERVLRLQAGSEQPFFMTVAPIAPHLERINGVQKAPRPAPRYKGRFAREPFPNKPSFNEADVSDKPAHIRKLPVLSTVKSARQVSFYRARLASLLAVDDLVERLVRVLTETGQLDRTVVLFTSDNGFLLGEHRVPDQKYYPYEEAIRVPLIIRGGGFPAGATAGQLVSNVDLAPTIVALAGAQAGLEMDGRPLLPLALSQAEGQDRTLLLEGDGAGIDKPSYKAVRDRRWLYVEHEGGDRELYDLESDPFELSSRHADAALAAVRADLASRLARLRDCKGQGCL